MPRLAIDQTPRADKQRESYIGIQSLRAIAALLVVAFHAIEAWNLQAPGDAQLWWPNGGAGVDIFFVISGFVMTVSTWRMAGSPTAWRVFIAHRLQRILPLYWFFSVLKIVSVAAAPSLALRTKLTTGYVVASFLFLPVHDAVGDFKPLLPVGWTLTFEMLFYVLFAIGLKLRMRTPLLIIPALVLLTLIPHKTGSVPGELCSPIMLEFGFGIIIATLVSQVSAMTRSLAWLMLFLTSAFILLVPLNILAYWDGRWLVLGLPAAFIVACIVALEPWFMRNMPRFVRSLGDASYAIYLSHGFMIAALAMALRRVSQPLHASFAAFLAWATVVVVASSLLGYAAHIMLERPLLRWMKGKRRTVVVPPVQTGD